MVEGEVVTKEEVEALRRKEQCLLWAVEGRSWLFWGGAVVALAAWGDASWVTVVFVVVAAAAAAAALTWRHVVGRTVWVLGVSVGVVRIEVQQKAI